jgi:hypothetical protein
LKFLDWHKKPEPVGTAILDPARFSPQIREISENESPLQRAGVENSMERFLRLNVMSVYPLFLSVHLQIAVVILAIL